MKPKFTTEADVRLLKGFTRAVMLLSDLIFFDNNGVEWIIPTGTIAGGRTSPIFTWPQFPVWVGLERRAIILHDHLCRERKRIIKFYHTHDEAIKAEADGIGDYDQWHGRLCVTTPISSTQAHNAFYQAMIADGVSKNSAKFQHFCVKTAGPKWRKA